MNPLYNNGNIPISQLDIESSFDISSETTNEFDIARPRAQTDLSVNISETTLDILLDDITVFYPDDLPDESETPSGVPTANSKWGRIYLHFQSGEIILVEGFTLLSGTKGWVHVATTSPDNGRGVLGTDAAAHNKGERVYSLISHGSYTSVTSAIEKIESQLINIFSNISGHDHAGNQSGKQIPTAGIENNAITTQKIIAGAVTPLKLAATNSPLDTLIPSYNAGTQTFTWITQSSAVGAAPDDATYIIQTTDSDLPNAQVLASLTTGLVKNTTTTGVLSIAAAGTDYESPITAGTTSQYWRGDKTFQDLAPIVRTTGGDFTGIDSITFDGVSSPAYAAGKLVYDTDNEALTFFNNESDVSLQIGQETWIRVRNETGSTIDNGKAVYVDGNHPGTQLPTIALARANSNTTAGCIGLTTHAIENNSIGYVTAIGVVHGLNTSGFSNGDSLYLSAATAGEITATPPSGAGEYHIKIGIVTRASAGSGAIAVFIENSQHLAILPLAEGGTGSALVDPNADRILFWDDSAGAIAFLTAGSGLQINTTTLSTTGEVLVDAVDATYGFLDEKIIAGDNVSLSVSTADPNDHKLQIDVIIPAPDPVLHRLTFAAAAGPDAANLPILMYDTAIRATGDTLPAVTYATQAIVNFSGSTTATASIPVDGYGRWSWTSAQAVGLTQLQLAVYTSFDKPANTISVYAKVRTDNVNRLDGLFIHASDSGGSNTSTSSNLHSSLVNNTWLEISNTGINVSSWGDQLRVGVTFTGTRTGANVGASRAEVESLWVEYET